jgi:hypothetical protein
MKLSPSLLLATSTNALSGADTKHVDVASNKVGQKILQERARRVEGRSGEGEQESWWLTDYSIKLISCMAGEGYANYESGQMESSTVIFRLCPIDSCTSNNTLGCDTGYADYAVGINTFAEAFAESVQDNYQFYEVNQVVEYIQECREIEDSGSNNYYTSGYSYIGLACSVDGTNIRLATFSDQVSDIPKNLRKDVSTLP